MPIFVYVIQNVTNHKIYIGYSSDLEKRLQRHNQLLPNKKTSFTSKNNGVWQVIYKEELSSIEEARQREKELKSSRGREFLKQFKSSSVG